MAEIKHNGKVYNLPRDTDKILSVDNGRIQVQCKAKRGHTDYWYYLNHSTLILKETKDKVTSKWNEKARTDAVNGINRPVSVEAKVKKGYKDVRATIKEENKARFDREVQDFIKAKAAELSK